ncbi:VanZ family protein [Saliterribacillus persicus]|uniref:VanZ like protein n=1 Tax=Saliterribacillus persicus TaxID=930114 RepID=A0A368YAR1_9BACI|nr:VanZ family protein [Saliterribacillus persicus]RCW77292.1 VanZ like protein [Saliterribacillus persicus]
MKRLYKIIFVISFIFYLCLLSSLLFLGSRGDQWSNMTLFEYMRASSNFSPLQTIKLYLNALINGSMNIEIPIKNLFGNLVLFSPMGLYLPYFFKGTRKIIIFITTMIVLLFMVEFIQIVTRRGSFDIDDFILNMIGALFGWLIAIKLFFKK